MRHSFRVIATSLAEFQEASGLQSVSKKPSNVGGGVLEEVACVAEAEGAEKGRSEEWVLAPMCFSSFLLPIFQGFVCLIDFCGCFPNVSGSFSTSLEPCMTGWLRKDKYISFQSSQVFVTFGSVMIDSEKYRHFSGVVRGLNLVLPCHIKSREIYASGKAGYDNLNIVKIMN